MIELTVINKVALARAKMSIARSNCKFDGGKNEQGKRQNDSVCIKNEGYR